MSDKKKKRAAELRCCLNHFPATVRTPGHPPFLFFSPRLIPANVHQTTSRAPRLRYFFLTRVPLAQSLRKLRSLGRGYPRHHRSAVRWQASSLNSSQLPDIFFFILLPFPLFFLSYGIIFIMSQERFREETVFTFSPVFSSGAYYIAYVNQLI